LILELISFDFVIPKISDNYRTFRITNDVRFASKVQVTGCTKLSNSHPAFSLFDVGKKSLTTCHVVTSVI
jgi:hypothetical protein